MGNFLCFYAWNLQIGPRHGTKSLANMPKWPSSRPLLTNKQTWGNIGPSLSSTAYNTQEDSNMYLKEGACIDYENVIFRGDSRSGNCLNSLLLIISQAQSWLRSLALTHGLWTLGDEIAFAAWLEIHSHSQIFRHGRSIFCLPHRSKFSDFFDLCLHWVSVVRASHNRPTEPR